MGSDRGVKKAWGALMMFILCFFSYQPLATGIDEIASNATTTNAVWVFMDSFFGLFWTVLIVMWTMVALYFLLNSLS